MEYSDIFGEVDIFVLYDIMVYLFIYFVKPRITTPYVKIDNSAMSINILTD